MAAAPRLPVRAVNLGGWLVTEGWILPSLFDGIPNHDLLDGTQLQFKSVTQNAYVAAENGGGAGLVENRPQASGWETFKLWRINEVTFNFKVFGNQFVGVQSDGSLVATAAVPRRPERFRLVRSPSDQYRMRIMAPNGLFLELCTTRTIFANWATSGCSQARKSKEMVLEVPCGLLVEPVSSARKPVVVYLLLCAWDIAIDILLVRFLFSMVAVVPSLE
ncbi:uncharacterized protein [Triticum aestivum]|uniref:uncharacterized protein n=1 Tax=Triticum aestivum TaxID=4565 RepID=UPI001D022980|nr:uncharacterized protein LOC123055619 [Triticum aestivum]